MLAALLLIACAPLPFSRQPPWSGDAAGEYVLCGDKGPYARMTLRADGTACYAYTDPPAGGTFRGLNWKLTRLGGLILSDGERTAFWFDPPRPGGPYSVRKVKP